jgi:hypothetical protein
MQQQQDSKTLTSWKEIAAYLQVSVRTAQLWEGERRLPVQRVPGKRSMVRAQVEELEAWLATTASASLPPPDAPPQPPLPPTPRRRWVLGAIAVLLVAAAGAAALVSMRGNRPVPAAVEVDGHRYRALDGAGRELWSKVSAAPVSANRYDALRRQQNVWIGDLAGNGEVVVLMTIPGEPARLACLEGDGNELWTYSCSRTVRTAANPQGYGPPYVVRGFAVLPPGPGEGSSKARRVVVTSAHGTYYPTQVALLNAGGEVQREYWHSGHFDVIRAWNTAAGLRVLLGGINNAFKQATLVVLDPDRFSGADDDDNPQYRLLEGQEQGAMRFVFPRTRLSLDAAHTNSLSEIRLQSDFFEAHVNETPDGDSVVLSYEFTPELGFRGLHLSSMTEGVRSRLMNGWNEASFVPQRVK